MSVMEESEIYVVVGEVMVLSARIEGSLESLTQGLFDRRDTRLVEFRRWLGRLKRIRERRNDLVHEVLKVAQSREKLGRWTSEIARMREECVVAPQWVQILRESVASTRCGILSRPRGLHRGDARST